MNNETGAAYFSRSYEEARARFVAAAQKRGAQLSSFPITVESNGVESVEDFTIDVAVLGSDEAPSLITSSGVHGVEGFLGSAVQLAWLETAETDSVPIRHVLIHAVNPFGFSRRRRFNEDNVDLNRNFIDAPSGFRGASTAYEKLDRFLNPASPPSRFEPFQAKAVFNIARYGMQNLKQAIAGGQYEFPKGIFFGGRAASQSTRIVMEHAAEWVGGSLEILHLDFHSGLGDFGEYKLLLAEHAGSPEVRWYEKAFGKESIEVTDVPAGTAYQASGPMGEWLQHRFSNRRFRFVTAEYGTYPPIRVLGALRAENRAHHYAPATSAAYQDAKSELVECFCPQDVGWRGRVVESGLQLIERGSLALLENHAG